MPNRTTKKVITGSVVSLVIVGVLAAVNHYKSGSSDEANAMSESSTALQDGIVADVAPTPTPITSNATPSSQSSFDDGVYTAISSYYAPPGVESIKVTLTISDGVVTDSSIQTSKDDRESTRYQNSFEAAYKSYVVGKDLATLELSYVAGASLTTGGFNDAVDAIINQAKG